MATRNKGRRLCSGCVGESFLRAKIERDGDDGLCCYCNRKGKTFSIEEMADELERVLNEHFYRTSTEPSDYQYAFITEDEYYGECDEKRLVDVISQTTKIDDEPAQDIAEVLAERIDRTGIGNGDTFDPDAHYAERLVSDERWQSEWNHFELSLKTEVRYFNRTAETMLVSIFEGIEEHSTSDGRPIVVEAGPEAKCSAFFRARVFQSDEKLECALRRPDMELGPPPPSAAIAGRMNAHGVSVFYGATDTATALAEVRPPVGSKVLVGRFELIRVVRLLDIEALQSLVNVKR